MAGNNPDRNHFEYLTSKFIDNFNSLPERLLNAGETPRPLDMKRYQADASTDQHNTCAKLAVKFYNQQQGNPRIKLLYAKDSHKFTSDDGRACYHANFKAAVFSGEDELERYTLFAEVTGDQNCETPVTVTMVTRFLTKAERMTRNNCSYCTGLRHPKEGGFVGHRPQEETDSSSEEEEGEEGGDDEDEEENDEGGN